MLLYTALSTVGTYTISFHDIFGVFMGTTGQNSLATILSVIEQEPGVGGKLLHCIGLSGK